MNSIAEHIADFLKQYPPFDNLTFQELSDIATSIRVILTDLVERMANAVKNTAELKTALSRILQRKK